MVGAQAAAYLLQTQLTMSLLQVRPRQFLRCYLPALWAGAWATVALWVLADQVRAMALPAGVTLFIEGLVWPRDGYCGALLRPVIPFVLYPFTGQ